MYVPERAPLGHHPPRCVWALAWAGGYYDLVVHDDLENAVDKYLDAVPL